MKRRLRTRPRSGMVALLAAAAALLGACFSAAAGAGPAAAADHSTAGAIAPVTSCSSLTGMNFSRVPDAPGTVSSAAEVRVRLSSGTVTFCDVKGVFAPQTHFKLLLPAASWHGQYVQEGCATLCGSVHLSDFPETGYTCAAVDNGKLALGTDDEGHTGGPADGSWARNSLALRVVFGVTSEHSLAQMSRAIMTAYYGRPASYAYYDGCSTGGREGLMLAQRYPDDFNGIIAGAPAANMAPLSAMFAPWLVRSNTGRDGHQILSAGNIPALHAAVMRACGNARVVAPGVIEDPRQCGFDPASIQCPPGTRAESCLTPTQVTAVRAFYRGPTDRQGRSLYNGGEPYGSELGWIGEFVEPASDKGAPADSEEARLSLNYLKYMASVPNPPSRFTLADVAFTDRAFGQADLLGNAIYNANDPDLRAFAAHGGKLILYHGWADQAIPPWSTLDYYAAVERTMRGFRASQSFSRLYMVPGAYHCLFAPDGSVNLANFLTPLISWVQRGVAPGTIAADTYSPTTKKITMREVVQPYNALAPVKPASGSLNARYRYIGSY